MTLDPAFYAEHGSRVHNQAPQSHEDCLSLLTSAPGITYLNHESTTVRLASPSGPRTELRVFGSPYSLRCSGLWGFQYDPDAAAALWDVIPSSIDVVITHGPSRSHLDDGPPGPGCEVLRRRLSQVRPVLAVCGHVHAGRGAEHVTWADDDSRSSDPPSSSALSVNPDEASVTSWDDPSPGFSGKMSLVDLTGRKQRGLPGPPPLGTMTSDGSPGRRQTCLVNAAIMRSSYPHIGGKQLNKPIVVDVELPMWEASEP